MINRMFSFGMLCWLCLLLGCAPSVKQEQQRIDLFYQRLKLVLAPEEEYEKHNYVYILEKRQQQIVELAKLQQDMHDLATSEGLQYLDTVVRVQLQPIERTFKKDLEIGKSLVLFANNDRDYILALKKYEFYQQEGQAIVDVLKHSLGLADYYRKMLEQARQEIVAAQLPAELQTKVWSETQDVFKQQIRDAEKDYLELSYGYGRYLEAMTFIFQHQNSFYMDEQEKVLKEVPGSHFWDQLNWILRPR